MKKIKSSFEFLLIPIGIVVLPIVFLFDRYILDQRFWDDRSAYERYPIYRKGWFKHTVLNRKLTRKDHEDHYVKLKTDRRDEKIDKILS